MICWPLITPRFCQYKTGLRQFGFAYSAWASPGFECAVQHLSIAQGISGKQSLPWPHPPTSRRPCQIAPARGYLAGSDRSIGQESSGTLRRSTSLTSGSPEHTRETPEFITFDRRQARWCVIADVLIDVTNLHGRPGSICTQANGSNRCRSRALKRPAR
jgi:hypothetical protein